MDEILKDGQTLPVLGGLRVVETPGHTPGHISLFAPAVGMLFCGDSMVTDENGIRGSRPGRDLGRSAGQSVGTEAGGTGCEYRLLGAWAGREGCNRKIPGLVSVGYK